MGAELGGLLALASREFAAFWLVFGRLFGLCASAPFFAHQSVPVQVRVLLALALSLVVFPLAPRSSLPAFPSLLSFGLALAGELALGLALGFLVALILSAVQMAGQILDYELGLGFSGVLDPAHGGFGSPFPTFLYLLALVLVLASGGDAVLIQGLAESFRELPPGSLIPWEALPVLGLEEASRAFSTALRLSFPVLAALFLVNLLLVFLGRALPQANVFLLSFPLKVLVGLGILAFAISSYSLVFASLYPDEVRVVAGFLGGIAR